MNSSGEAHTPSTPMVKYCPITYAVEDETKNAAYMGVLWVEVE